MLYNRDEQRYLYENLEHALCMSGYGAVYPYLAAAISDQNIRVRSPGPLPNVNNKPSKAARVVEMIKNGGQDSVPEWARTVIGRAVKLASDAQWC